MQKSVDDWVDSAVADRQAVHGRVDEHEEVFLRYVFVLGEVRSEVD